MSTILGSDTEFMQKMLRIKLPVELATFMPQYKNKPLVNIFYETQLNREWSNWSLIYGSIPEEDWFRWQELNPNLTWRFKLVKNDF